LVYGLKKLEASEKISYSGNLYLGKFISLFIFYDYEDSKNKKGNERKELGSSGREAYP
jgi:hypothetical protein